MRSLLVVLACSFPFTAPPAQTQPNGGAARLFKSIPMGELMAQGPGTTDRGLPLGILCGGFREPDAYRSSLVGTPVPGGNAQDANVIDQLVRQLTPGVNFDEGLSLEWHGAVLFANGPAESVRALETTTRRLVHSLYRPLRVTAELYRLPGETRVPAVLGKDRGDWTRSAQRLWLAAVTVRSGSTARLEQYEDVSFVARCSVEVAQEARIGAPAVEQLFEGVGLRVTPHCLTGSTDLVLFCQFALSEQREPMTQCPSGMEDVPSIDVPHLDAVSGTFSGRIEAGGALVLSIRNAADLGPSYAMLVTAEPAAVAPQDAIEPGFFPVGAFLSPALAHRFSSDTSSESPGAHKVSATEEVASETQLDPDALMNLINNAVPQAGGEDTSLEMVGDHVWAHAKDARRDEMAKFLRHLQDQWFQTARVETLTVREPEPAGDGALARAPGGGTLHRALSFPALFGRHHVIVAGQESTAMGTYLVEIAQKSSISVPQVDSRFSGMVLKVHPYATQTGLGVDVTLDSVTAQKPRRRPRETKDGSDVYLARTQQATFEHHGPVPAGELALGEGVSATADQTRLRTKHSLRIGQQ